MNKPTENEFVNTWETKGIYTVRTKDIEAWFLHYGEFAVRAGTFWKPRCQKLFPGIYRVMFEKVAIKDTITEQFRNAIKQAT